MSLSDKNPPILSRDSIILIFLALGTLLLRYVTLMEVNIGGDNIDYWYYGKSLLNGYPYDFYFHRSIRWGIILPTMLIQLIFGQHAWAIYLPSVFMSVLLNYSVFLLGNRLFDKRTAWLSIILIQFFPYMIRMGSQLFLGVFSMNYIVLSFYFLILYMDPKNDKEKARGKLWFLLSLGFLFLSYLTKITNLYFLLPWLILLWQKKGVKSAFFYGLILLGLYLMEHLGLYLATGESMGRLGIISSTHLGNSTMQLDDGTYDGTFWGLFGRYSLEFLPFYWQLLLWPGIGAGLFLYVRRDSQEKNGLRLVFYPILFFLFLITFGIKGFRPVVPFENFHSRYFSSILPFLALFLCRFLWFIADHTAMMASLERVLPHSLAKNWPVWLFSLPLALLILLSLLLPYLPSALGQYLNNPFDMKEHILGKTIRWERQINDAAQKNILLSCWTEGPKEMKEKRNSKKSLDTVNRLYLKLPKRQGAYRVVSHEGKDGTVFQWLEGLPGGAKPENAELIYRFYREPFELVEETSHE